MKKILVPTDFSPVADNALHYAIDLAAQYSGEILLYHVYSFHKRVDYDPRFPDDQQPYIKNIEKQMELTKSKVQELATEKGVNVQSVVEENRVYYLFKNKVMQHGADLIVMGTTGASGANRVIFGSVAVTALESARVPVLVVPPEYHLHKIEQVLLATDLNDVSEDVLIPLEELITKSGAELTVLSVMDERNKNIHEKSELEFKGVQTNYREIKMSNSINESINTFVEANHVDMVCMIRREKGFFEDLFKKSITRTQVYQTKIPFLVLTDQKA